MTYFQILAAWGEKDYKKKRRKEMFVLLALRLAVVRGRRQMRIMRRVTGIYDELKAGV